MKKIWLIAYLKDFIYDVKTGLIKSRRIVFTPSVDLKDELANTAIQITCIDRNGAIVKRVTSDDSGVVEDNENENGNENTGEGENQNGGNTNGGTNDNVNPNPNEGGGDDNGGGDEPGEVED